MDAELRSAPAGSAASNLLKIPNGNRAVVDISKLRDYCLSEQHTKGRHKARVFASVLGLKKEDADVLRQALLEAAVTADAVIVERDTFGQRYVLDFVMHGPVGHATVRSSWIILSAEDFPRMTTCYVL